MDRPNFQGDESYQDPSDYLPGWLDPVAGFDNYHDRPASAERFLPAKETDEACFGDLQPGASQAFPQGFQDDDYNYFPQPDSEGPMGRCPWFSCHGQDTQDAQSQNNIAIRIDRQEDIAFSFSTDHGVPMHGVPLAGTPNAYKSSPIHSGYSSPYCTDTMDSYANPISSESSRDNLVPMPDIPSPKKNRRAADTRLGAVNQGILTPDIQLGRSAPEHPTDYRPTNGFLSPSRIPQRPVPSQSLTSSPLGCSPEGTDSVGGASWGMQINFDSKSGQEVQVRGVKRRSTEEKEENARLRARGGACESCRKKHRKCNHRSDDNPEVAKLFPLPSSRTLPKGSATRNPEPGNLTRSFTAQKMSDGPGAAQPTSKHGGRLQATDLPVAQVGNMGFHNRGFDDFQDIGFQFGSIQNFVLPRELEGEDLPRMSTPSPRGEPQHLDNAIHPNDQHPSNARRKHNTGFNPSPYPSYLQGLDYAPEALDFHPNFPTQEMRDSIQRHNPTYHM